MAQILTHVTVGYPRLGLMDLLGETAEWHGCRHVALPKHWPLSPFNNTSKITVFKNYLDAGEIDSGEIVLFTDAFDVTIVEHASVITEKFLSTGAALVFSAESHFWPLEGRESVRAQFDSCDSKWKYLNSGGYIGYVWAIRKMLDYCAERINRQDYDFYRPEDQALVQRFFLEHVGSSECPVALDTLPAIFCSLNTSEGDFSFCKGRVVGVQSKAPVSVLHANGSKHNFDIMRRCWALNGGPEGVPARRDLRIATGDGHALVYNRALERFVQLEHENNFPTVFLLKGERQAICLSDAHGLLTFTPQGALHPGAEIVNVWEVLNVRGSVTTYHGTGLDAYLESGSNWTITMAYLPLTMMLHQSFDRLLCMIKQYESRF